MSALARLATWRVQLGPDHGFDDVARDLGDLAAAGASHVYLSPVMRAAPGSAHGYDVVDPAAVAPALGGERGFARLADAAAAAGVGLVVDVVPNHLAATAANASWWSLLRDGPDGPGARVFDVDWEAPDVPGRRVLVPVLGRPLAEEIEHGALHVDRRGPEPVLTYHEHRFPLAPGTDDPARPVAEVLGRQHYELAFWRDGSRRGNYRRFFDVGDLAAIRVEDPEVFDAVHGRVLRWAARGLVDGVRVDHVDGLADPAGYLTRLRDRLGPDRWILVEKILDGDEELPADWPVDGTTGYEHADRIDGFLVDPAGALELAGAFGDATGDHRPWSEHVAAAKAQVLAELFRADLDRLVRAVSGALGSASGEADDLTGVVARTVVALDGYRTYVTPGGRAGPDDTARIDAALARAAPGAPGPTVAAWRALLVGETVGPLADAARTRFQQLTGPVAAKGVEDTAMYRFVPLPGRCEVGADPSRASRTVDEVHDLHRRVARRGRATLLAATTHDTKRAGDVRARMHALADDAGVWRSTLSALSARAARYRTRGAPEPALEWLLWHTVVGAWPVDASRLRAYLRKAAREAKTATSWLDPDPAYEDALDDFVDGVLADVAIRDEVARAVARVLVPGRVRSLARVLVQCTAPGVPDCYRGDEIWYLALVDPDNRRPVDGAALAALVAEVGVAEHPPLAALADPDDPGRPKLWCRLRALALRHRHAAWFAPGAPYEALDVRGPAGDRMLAYRRTGAVVVVPGGGAAAPEPGAATLELPPGRWRSVLAGPGTVVDGGAVDVAGLLEAFPVALLARA